MLHVFVSKVIFLCLNMLYSREQISCTWPVPSVRFSVKMHLTKCHDRCDVLHDVVSLLHSIVCSVHNNISPISPFAYQICVGKLMPLSAMFVNCNVLNLVVNDESFLVHSHNVHASVWSWSRNISYRLIRLRIVVLIRFRIIWQKYLIPFRIKLFDPAFRITLIRKG